MKKLMLIGALMLMGCGSTPLEPEMEMVPDNPYNVSVSIGYDDSIRVCEVSWTPYGGEGVFDDYAVIAYADSVFCGAVCTYDQYQNSIIIYPDSPGVIATSLEWYVRVDTQIISNYILSI